MRMKLSIFRILPLAAALLAFQCEAAPFANWFDFVSPGGAKIRIWGEGDEYSAHFEAEDGHTVVYDAERRCYVYARKSGDGSGALVATLVAVGDETEADRAALEEIPLHIRDTSRAADEERARRIAEMDGNTGRAKVWEKVKAATAARRAAAKAAAGGKRILTAPPPSPALGTAVGLTVLIDFPDTDSSGQATTLARKYSPSVTYEAMVELLNGDNFTQFGNVSSVKEYYRDVSCGRFTYTNIVLRGPDRGFFTLSKPRSYYDDTSRNDNGPWTREMQSEVLSMIAGSASYDTEYLPALRQLSQLNGSFRALNFLFAGPSSGVWSKGLWPHKGYLAEEVKTKLPVDVGGSTVYFGDYQMTHLDKCPAIGTICHENGHMVCGFPDLYDYAHGNGGGGVDFSLMSCSGSYNPIYVDAYLRAAAGWVEPKELPASPCTVVVSNRLDDVWKYTNGADDSQYYLVENRQKKGRDSNLPGSGVLIWRCDEKGSDVNPVKAEAFSDIAPFRTFAEAIPEQADGRYDIEQRKDICGEQYDLWYAGNRASGYTGVFHADGVPCARWRNAERAGIRLSNFSASGDVMTFDVGDAANPGAPVMDAAVIQDDDRATVRVSAKSLGIPEVGFFVYADVMSVNPAGTSTNSYTMLVGRLRSGVMNVERTVSGLALGWTHFVGVWAAPDTGGDRVELASGAKVRFRTDPDLSVALDAPNVPFWNSRTDNMTNWYVRGNGEAKTGYTCIRTGEKASPGDWGICDMYAMVKGPGKLSFWWKTATPEKAFVLACWRRDEGAENDTYIDAISGDTGWRQVTVRVPSGNCRFNWYFWDIEGYGGGDAYAWMDSVTWEPDDRLPPSAPSDVAATQGTLTNGVLVTWREAAGARNYRVWRGETAERATAVLLGETEECRFLDELAVGGRVYRYWVEPANLAGCGEPAGPAAGWTPAPLAVVTTDLGTGFAGEVGAWTFAASGGRRPYSWRITAHTGIPQGISFDETAGTLFGAPLESGLCRINVEVEDANGSVAPGSAKLKILGAPARTEFTSISRPGKFNLLIWGSVSNADWYMVYRSAGDDFSSAELLADGLTSPTYSDTSAEEGVIYTYWVVCANEYGESPASNPISTREISAPGTYYVDAANGSYGYDGTSPERAVPGIDRALYLAGGRKCVVKVAPGVYGSFADRNTSVVIESTDGPDATFIDGRGRSRCATLSIDGVGTNSVLAGFTLVNGYASDGKGGGAFGGTLERCVISNCTAFSSGGAAYGGGAFGSVLDNCLVVSNVAESAASGFESQGGGAYGATMYNCTLAGNAARAADVSLACGAGAMGGAAFNTVMWGNVLEGDGETVCAPGVNAAGVRLRACSTQEDPVFCGAAPRPWRLSASSPCIDAGDAAIYRRRNGYDLAGAWRSFSANLGCYCEPVIPSARSLAAVSGLRGRYDGDMGGALIRWKADPQAATYRVYRGNSKATSNARLVAEVDRARYFDEDAVEGVTYWYRVVPANTNVTSFSLSSSTACLELDTSADVADLYVDWLLGRNSNDGRSRDAPLETLQAAANAAEAGDVVLVAANQYSTFSSWGTSFEMRSEAGPAETKITGGGRRRCATLAMTLDREATNTVLRGFTLHRGNAGEDYGCVGGGALGGTLVGCVVSNCQAGAEKSTTDAMGGGVAGSFMLDCEICECECVSGGGNARGGGVANSTLAGCSVHDNKAESRNASFSAYGGGVYGSYACDSEITGNTAANTKAAGGGRAYGGGIYGYEACRSAIWGNECVTYADVADAPITELFDCVTSAGEVLPSGGGEAAEPLSVATRSLPGGAPGDAYSARLEAAGGVAPYRWSASVAAGGRCVETHEAASAMPRGSAQYWRGDDNTWSRTLPFEFPFYGVKRKTVWVNANGHIAFDGAYGSSSYSASDANLKSHAMVAVLWKDLRTDNGGNIYTDFSASEATIRWEGSYYGGSKTNVNFAVTLRPDGTIRLRYGGGNSDGGVIGVSAGDGVNFVVSTLSQSGSMANAGDIVFTPQREFPPGLSLSSEGVLSGVPERAGTWILDVFAADDAGASASAALKLVVDPGLFYTTQSPVPVAYTWLNAHPSLLSASGVDGDYEAAAKARTGERDSSGASLMAWYDYLVGTAPEEQDDVFTASIDFVDGEPVVTWTPDLNEGGLRHLRNYIVEGKTNLTDSAWHSPTNSSSRFFRVRVEMPQRK